MSILRYVTPANDSLLIIAAVDIVELVILSWFNVSTISPIPLPAVEAPRTNLLPCCTGCMIMYDELELLRNDVPIILPMMLSTSVNVNVLFNGTDSFPMETAAK